MNRIKGAVKRMILPPANPVELTRQIDLLCSESEKQSILMAQPLIQSIKNSEYSALNAFEFKVFSQFGDDGILQSLIHHCKIQESEKRFIEFGVQDYSESNTRFLLMNNYWKGLVIDGSSPAIEFIKSRDYYWRYSLKAVQSFITKENINLLFESNGFAGDIGLLSIDLDGVDYWVWEAITVVNPVIVVAEYNSLWGPNLALTVPYNASFTRGQAHYSNQYWGTSVAALNVLAERKGYSFVGTNLAGNNAYFVRKDRLGSIKSLKVKDGFHSRCYRDSRDAEGNLNFLEDRDALKQIVHLTLTDIASGQLRSIKELFFDS